MNSESLMNYIKNENLLDPVLFDNLRYELDKHVYYYGEHFKNPNEKSNGGKENRKFNALLKNLYFRYKVVTKSKPNGKLNVVSNAYFNFNDKLSKEGYNVITPCWGVTRHSQNILGTLQLYNAAETIKKELINNSFNYLINSEFINKIEIFQKQLTDAYLSEDIRALFIPNDVSFFENSSLNSFKKIEHPSFIFLHGLPGRYNIVDDNRSDYLIVWGEKIKQNYIDKGFEEDKIIISGHPYYKSITSNELRFGLSNILVLGKAAAGSPHSVGMTLYDRGSLIVYLLSIQKLLKKLNVDKVRLRLHPSANAEWHYKFIDRNFFVIDNSTLPNSLALSTLVIGPTSSVFLEALAYGVNYLVYEPGDNNKDLLNEKLVPPFDGSESGVPVACNTGELQKIIEGKKKVNHRVFNDYISSPFDISFLKQYIL